MIDFVTEVVTRLKSINPETYHGINRQTTITYPYITYDIDSVYVEGNVEGYNVDIEICDHNTSPVRILELEEQIKDSFKDLKILTPDVYIRFKFEGSTRVLSGDENVIRRNTRLYAKTDWRKK